jgi:hypothetical protein
VQQGDFPLGAQAAQRRLQLERLVDRFPHEQLDDLLAPGAEGPAAEPAGESLDPGEPHPVQLDGVAVEHLDPRLAQDALELRRLPRLVVVVPQHRHDRQAEPRERLGDLAALLRLAPVGQVAAEDEDVRLLGHVGEDALHRGAIGRAPQVDVAQGGDPHDSGRFGHRPRNQHPGWPDGR